MNPLQRGDRHQEKQGKNNRSWTRALRLKKALDLTDGMDSEPTFQRAVGWQIRLGYRYTEGVLI